MRVNKAWLPSMHLNASFKTLWTQKNFHYSDKIQTPSPNLSRRALKILTSLVSTFAVINRA